MLLALDTSNHHASVALVKDGQLAAELTWEVGRRHSQELLERVRWLCASCAARPADLTSVAAALGPGSFNGARVAVTTAKALAFALNLPIYGCSTLDAIACGHMDAHGTLVALLDAGRGEVYAGIYFVGRDVVAPSAPSAHGIALPLVPGLWRLGEPLITMPDALARTIAGPFLVCGEWQDSTRAALEHAAGARVHFAQRFGGRRASWLAALALHRVAHGEPDSAMTLEPLYLRRPAITSSAKHTALGLNFAPAASDQLALHEQGDSHALRH